MVRLDLKPAKVLVSGEGRAVLAGGFGQLAHMLQEGETRLVVGSSSWLASLQSDAFDANRLGT